MADKEILVEVSGVSKKFSLSLKNSMLYGVKDIFASLFGERDKGTLRKGEFWAVKDISFQLRRGECMALIGHNGAGKSTLLKMLNGLIAPDEGSIKMRGKVGALIELGAGFNPILTGRENVYVNGQILGFTKKEIDAKMDEILAFAEIGEFIDSPVQNYSSGMKVRLGFAVAAQMEPDILLIDEVMAVGDITFQGKCYNKIFNLIDNTCIILVSHSMPQVSRICNKGILMDHGKLLKNGTIQEAVMNYYSIMPSESGNTFTADNCRFISIGLNSLEYDKEKPLKIMYGSNMDIDLCFYTPKDVVNIKVHFVNRDLHVIASVKFDKVQLQKKDDRYFVTLNEIGPIIFMPGEYKISVSITDPNFNVPLIYFNAFWKFEVTGTNFESLPSSILLNGTAK